MGDILRVSLSMKRYSDLLKWKDQVQKMDGFVINPERIKNKFCDNDVHRYKDFSEKISVIWLCIWSFRAGPK